MGKIYFRHGHGSKKNQSPEYKCWIGVKKRCYEKQCHGYERYGGRGIIMCDRWKFSFANFLSDMGPKPSLDHSLDRFPDVNGNYEPGNCRWATRKEQSRNKRNNIYVDYNGEKVLLADLAEKNGLESRVVRDRLKSGWELHEAVTTPLIKHPPKQPYIPKGVKKGKDAKTTKVIIGTCPHTGQEFTFYGLREAAEFVGGNKSNIANSIAGLWKYKGWVFRHA